MTKPPRTLIERLERAMDYLDKTMPLNGRDRTHPALPVKAKETGKAA